jgi:DNA-binding transcriptional ArsR family regulator
LRQLFFQKEDRLIRISFPPAPEESLALTVSPLLECVLSLHVLLGPKHHVLQHEWVRRMRRLPAGLRREIEAYGFVYRRQIPDLFLPSPHGPAEDFEQELARLEVLGPELLLQGLGRPLYDHGGRPGAGLFDDPAVRRAMLERARADRSRSAATLLLNDPVAFVGRLTALLERYWTASFASEWERLDELLARSLSRAGTQLASVGIWPVLGRLPPHCRVDPLAAELLVDLPHDHRVQVSADHPLVLSPSAFVWPHLLVSCDPPWPLALVYAAPEIALQAEPRLPPAELLRILRALGDDTRLRVLRLIAERPRTTQELSPIVGLSRAGVSKCLRLLAEAGLVAAKREGYYVVYSLAPGRLDAVSKALSEFLRTPRDSPTPDGRVPGGAPRPTLDGGDVPSLRAPSRG